MEADTRLVAEEAELEAVKNGNEIKIIEIGINA